MPRVRADLQKLEPDTMNLEDFLAKVSQDAKARK